MGTGRSQGPLRIAVVGSGIAGLSCAWLLNSRHDVVIYEAEARLGGHANTVDADGPSGLMAVDTGFIVYNEANYPNLTALFHHLAVPTKAAEMSFGVSLDHGALEYGSAHPMALLAQPRNLVRPRFWSMLRDLVRFYREAPQALAALERQPCTLGELLDRGGYGRAFQDDHLLPQVGAIWSTSPADARDYPAEALIRFFENHGLLKLARRPQWRTVEGGSRTYVERLASGLRLRSDCGVSTVRRTGGGVLVGDVLGRTERFDRVVLAVHADQALAMLATPTLDERSVLGAFRYSRNVAVLHRDPGLMPRRRAAWSAWNHIGQREDPGGVCVTYWMNMLQGLPRAQDLFVTLNPPREPAPGTVIGRYTYDHPLFDTEALRAQRRLWSLQGEGDVWFCGAYFGAGFHEDGLQAGLAVAEQVGGVRRPWRVGGESGRIHLGPSPLDELAA
ncbi:MAG: FAD-dependent oxidoreductase [Caulobacteraceae bacterium]